ncbi:MAG: heme-binding domain-containing protein [Longimicrobiales bacterium]|nr:heme-binding domain-containing protein [Longimicrobiales bacterium]
MNNRMKALSLGALALVVMQLLPVERSNPPADGPLVIQDPVVADIVERACSDCHTHDTSWPWYARVAPVSWWVADHVAEGREHLNFSVWQGQTAERRDHKLEEVVEYVEEREMPLRSYMLGHPEARITDQEREVLIRWANGLRGELGVAASSGEDEGHDEEGEPGERP